MARFKYVGNYLSLLGPCTKIRIPKSDGTKTEITAADQTNGFVLDEDIGVEITDDMSLRYLRADSKFEEII